MGKTSAAVKNRWNADHYDTIRFTVPKGEKDIIQAQAESKGQSLSEYIRSAIEHYNKSSRT
jgi:hypothetical protein